MSLPKSASMPVRPRRDERGFAAAAALLTLVLASTIGAVMAELARLETVLARQRKVTVSALGAVDACAEDVVASLPAGWEFTDVLLGSDGLSGTADDGTLPLSAGCTGAAREAPGAPTPHRVLVELEATRRGGRRRIEAVLRRHTDPGVPALLWVADPAAIGRVSGTLTLDGVDPARPQRPLAILAAPDEPPALDGWVAAQGAALVSVGGSEGPLWAPPPPLASLAARAASVGALAPTTGLVSSPPAPPRVLLSVGDLVVTTPQFGTGVLVVQGTLAIDAPFTFAGVVAATGGVRVGPTGLLDVQGALWLGADSLEALTIEGSASVVASAAGLTTADALLPLPRRAMLASVRDF